MQRGHEREPAACKSKKQEGKGKKQQKETRKGVRRRGNENTSVMNPDSVCEAVSKPHSKQCAGHIITNQK